MVSFSNPIVGNCFAYASTSWRSFVISDWKWEADWIVAKKSFSFVPGLQITINLILAGFKHLDFLPTNHYTNKHVYMSIWVMIRQTLDQGAWNLNIKDTFGLCLDLHRQLHSSIKEFCYLSKILLNKSPRSKSRGSWSAQAFIRLNY